MSRAVNVASAVAAVEAHGALLLYPVENRREPRSLWHHYHPRSAMRWDWDSTGDDRVVALWRLRERLARSRRVVYGKWYRGRATFFSRELFTAMLATYHASGDVRSGLDPDANDVLEALESDSPRSTKELRAEVGLRGRMFEGAYQRALGALWSRLLIVGFGEVDDGAFPSLAIGATRALFEDLWDEALSMDPARAARVVAACLPPGSALARQHAKTLATLGSTVRA